MAPLRADWRQVLFPEADDAHFADGYSSYCKNPPPPKGDLCENLKGRLQHAQQCLKMREEFARNWRLELDDGHRVENANWRQRIRNLEDEMREMCPDQCEALGIQ